MKCSLWFKRGGAAGSYNPRRRWVLQCHEIIDVTASAGRNGVTSAWWAFRGFRVDKLTSTAMNFEDRRRVCVVINPGSQKFANYISIFGLLLMHLHLRDSFLVPRGALFFIVKIFLITSIGADPSHHSHLDWITASDIWLLVYYWRLDPLKKLIIEAYIHYSILLHLDNTQ